MAREPENAERAAQLGRSGASRNRQCTQRRDGERQEEGQETEGRGRRRRRRAVVVHHDTEHRPSAEESVDDIFAALKKEKRPPKAEKPEEKSEARRRRRRAEDDKWRAGRPPTPPGRQENPQVHRYAADGLPVYKYFHLGMDQQDGGTPLCPFDCDCCFRSVRQGVSRKV